MEFEAHICIIQFFIFYYNCNLAIPLVGPKIRSAQPNEFPFIVSIMSTQDFDPAIIQNFHKCTGTLVSKKDVLTAEHCVANSLSGGFKVMAGSHDLTRASPYYALFVWTYERWARSRNREPLHDDDDMAFIKLMKGVPDTIEFAPTGNLENHFLWGLDLTVAGFGRLANNSMPIILQAIGVKVLTKTNCEEKHYTLLNETIILDETYLCTVGEPYAILNQGDSGGPLLFYGALIGINVGIFPVHGGTLNRYQINLHMGIRHYQRFIADAIHSFGS